MPNTGLACPAVGRLAATDTLNTTHVFLRRPPTEGEHAKFLHRKILSFRTLTIFNHKAYSSTVSCTCSCTCSCTYTCTCKCVVLL